MSEGASNETVSSLFDQSLNIYHELSETMIPSNHPDYQVCILNTNFFDPVNLIAFHLFRVK